MRRGEASVASRQGQRKGIPAASQVVKMVGQIINGEEVDVNDTETYDNGVIVVPSYLCEPVFADANNYKELLIDSGYYTEDQLK